MEFCFIASSPFLLLALNTAEIFRIAVVQGSYCKHGERLCSAQASMNLSTSWLLVIWRKKKKTKTKNPELESKFLWLASKCIPNWYTLPSQITVAFAFCSSIISLPIMREKKLCTNKILIRTLLKIWNFHPAKPGLSLHNSCLLNGCER